MNLGNILPFVGLLVASVIPSLIRPRRQESNLEQLLALLQPQQPDNRGCFPSAADRPDSWLASPPACAQPSVLGTRTNATSSAGPSSGISTPASASTGGSSAPVPASVIGTAGGTTQSGAVSSGQSSISPEFRLNVSGADKIAQENSWSCAVVAGMNSLNNVPGAADRLSQSMQRLENGNYSLTFANGQKHQIPASLIRDQNGQKVVAGPFAGQGSLGQQLLMTALTREAIVEGGKATVDQLNQNPNSLGDHVHKLGGITNELVASRLYGGGTPHMMGKPGSEEALNAAIQRVRDGQGGLLLTSHGFGDSKASFINRATSPDRQDNYHALSLQGVTTGPDGQELFEVNDPTSGQHYKFTRQELQRYMTHFMPIGGKQSVPASATA
jgi:hypothetical protein